MVIEKRLISERRIALKKCRHGYFAYNPNDLFIGRSMDLYGEWCDTEIETLSQVVRPGDLLIDVGANIGTHTVPLAQRVGFAGGVLAFEPQPSAFHILCANVALNDLANARCVPKAVGAPHGVVKIPSLNPDAKQNFGGLSLERHGKTESGELTEVVTIDSLRLPACHLIKVDVEGMEVQVLSGAREIIRRCRPVLFVECNQIKEAPPLLALLEELEYRAWWHIAEYYRPANFFANPENEFAKLAPEANLLCFPRERPAEVRGLSEVSDRNDNWQKALYRANGRMHGVRDRP